MRCHCHDREVIPLFVSKITHGIQGEGPTAGHPCIFLVLGGDKSRNMKIMDIVKKIKELSKHNCFRIVVTGDEPLEYQQELIAVLIKKELEGFKTEIETCGLIMPDIVLRNLVAQWNITIRPGSQWGVNAPDSVMFFSTQSNVNFKLELESKKDIKKMIEIIETIDIQHDQIYLMPKANSLTDLILKSKDVESLCKKHDLIYGSKHQIILGGCYGKKAKD